MNVKSDTKEKFCVITPVESNFADNLAAEWEQLLTEYAQKNPPHLVINFSEVMQIGEKAATTTARMQQFFYESNLSCVLCCLQPEVESVFDQLELLEVMNVTPTESEAWDIVQMEEIEREILGGEE